MPEPEDADKPRPLTRDGLLRRLDNIVKMHEFAETVSDHYGSPSHRLYHDGMATCAKFISECVKLTPVGTL